MKSKVNSIIIIFFLITSLCSCTAYTDRINKTSSKIDSCFQEDKLEYTNIIGDSKLAETIFKKELNLKNLNNHKLYYSPGQYNFVINFDSSVTSVEIDNFMSYFSTLFISMHPTPIGGLPYQSELMILKDNTLKSENKPYEKLSLRVYIDNVKAFRYDYTFKNLKLISCKYWENTYIDYNFKALKNKCTDNFIKENKSLSKTISIRKTFKNDGIIIVKVKSPKKCSTRYISNMKEKIEHNLAPTLEKEAFDKYKTNFQYLGIILQFQVKDAIYEEYVYYNGRDEDKGWINVDWMEYKFLSSYIQNQS